MQLFVSLAIPFAALLANAGLAVAVLFYGPRGRLNQVFALYLLCLTLWALGALLMRIWPAWGGSVFWNKVEGAGVVALYAPFFHFVVLYLGLGRLWPLVWLGYALAIGYVYAYFADQILVLTSVQGGLVDYDSGVIQTPFIITGLFFIALAGYLLIREYHRSCDSQFRLRTSYILFSVGMTVAGGLVNTIPAIGRYPLDLAINVFSAALIGYAVLRHQLLEVRVLLRAALVYGVLVVEVGVAYLLLLILLQATFETSFRYQALIGMVTAIILIALLFQWLRRAMQRWIDRLFYRGTYVYREILKEFSEAVVSILNLSELTERMLGMVSQTFGTSQVAIFLIPPEGRRLALQGQVGLGHLPEDYRSLRNDNPIVSSLDRGEKGVLSAEEVSHSSRFHSLWDEEKRQVVALKAELFVSLHCKGRLIGILTVGPKASGEGYSGDDVELLTTLANQAAIAVENARLYEALRQDLQARQLELNQAQSQLLQAAKLADLGQLSASIAHEINNPLTGVLMASSLLLEDLPSDDPRRSELEIILREAQRARTIVRSLLDFARQTEGRVELIDINEVVQNALALAGRQAELRGVAILENYALEQIIVTADRNQLQQAILNVVHNALDATPKGGRLTIGTQVVNGRVKVTCQDTGKGIPENILPKIFDPFFTTKREVMGTGLGLSITHGIITKYGGTIDVSSSEGEGTTFTIQLPVADAKEGQG
ncbi:MAG: GAF domain-containing protein [Chloroflexi bacterium]|nr:GAF domain-containing protein [Chloroflexota bacterium]